MQRVLDPAQIEAFGTQRTIPRVRLPDPSNVFSIRAQRLRKLSEGSAVGDYLRLMAVLADAQQAALDRLMADQGAAGTPVENAQRGASVSGAARTDTQTTFEEHIRQAKAHGMPLLQAAGERRDPIWHTILHQLCDTIAAAAGFPGGVAAACARLREVPAQALEEQADLLLVSSSENVDAQAAPFIMAALQVHWVRLVCSLGFDSVAEHVGRVDVPGVCPVCGTLPVASIVRAEKAYQGYRYLHCALCATEWHMVRIKCSHCLSTAGIHYHSIEGGSSAVRAESCDVCRTYRKICYEEHDTAVEPVADDLASLALDLLMTEEGFHRGSGNPLLFQSA
jgi:FdhE protein